MFKLDNDFLVSLGLGTLPVDEKNKLLQAIYERLEMNVGMRLAEKMTDAQLDEFEGFIDRNDEAGALRWLEGNFPNYKDVVAEELEKLKVEVRGAAPQILAAAQSTPVRQPAQMPGVEPVQPATYFDAAQSSQSFQPQQGNPSFAPSEPAQPAPQFTQPQSPTPDPYAQPAHQPWAPPTTQPQPNPGPQSNDQPFSQPPAGFPPQQQ